MFGFINNFLNNITMYRLLLYILIVYVVIGEIFSLFHLLPFTPTALFFSSIFLVGICWITNTILAKIFRVQTNVESVYISALILSLVITPTSIIFLATAGVLTIVSKYVANTNNKHIFNPVAFGIWLAGLLTGQYASWWIGTVSMLPFIIAGGFLIIKKIRRIDMVFIFFIIAVLTIFGYDILNKIDIFISFKKILFETPILFFASVMLTEPLTTPPTNLLQNIYGGLVGFLYCPLIHLGNFYTTPETALLIGNIFSYIVSPKIRLRLHLKEKIQITRDISDFVFLTPQKFSFLPGQYMEWTLSHNKIDSRGNRRYFTIASSPTEKNLVLGIRFNPNGSTFKNTLANLSEKDEIIGSQIAGDFVMPKDINKKLVFIAGGIGVTPFRSMVQYLLDKKEKRDIIVVYTAKNVSEFAYKNIFDRAAGELGIKVIYTITDTKNVPVNWKGYSGRITRALIKEEIPDFTERIFFLSGPNAMVESFEKTLKGIGVKKFKKDYFPGFA